MTTTEDTAEVPQPAFTHRAYGVDVEWFGGEGGMIARGHVADLRFVAACNHLARTAGMRNVFDEPRVTLDEVLAIVTQCWGVPAKAADFDPDEFDWALRYDRAITEETPGAIAVTVLAP